MEVLVIFAIIASIVSGVMKSQQKNAKNQPPRVREAPAPETKPQTAQVFRAASPSPMKSEPKADDMRDVARDSTGTITATDRVAMVSRLTDTARERAAIEKKAESAFSPADGQAEPADEAQEAFSREILRGVIMSEILTRPAQRKPAWRRS